MTPNPMPQNCSIGYYPTADRLSTRVVSELLTAAGYTLLGDYRQEDFMHFSAGECRFCLDVTDRVTRGIDEGQLALVPVNCRYCLVVHFDRRCFPELVRLIRLLIVNYGGVVIEGLGAEANYYGNSTIDQFPGHPTWADPTVD